MRWTDADVFLKILEEPPDSATLILLAPTPGFAAADHSLALPAIPIRAGSRPTQIVSFLKVANHAEGRGSELRVADSPPAAPAWLFARPRGVATACDSAFSAFSIRPQAPENTAELFAATAQLAKQEKESFENILALFYSLLTDLLEISQGPRSRLPRNPDLSREVEALARRSIGNGSPGYAAAWTA